MAIFKCKMCGGTIEIQQGESVGVCEYCGTKQTLPRLDDERKVNLYDRANHFRRNNDFDKAMGIYEQILNEDGTDAEAYWSLVLCRYGIEYVEDPATKKRIPTVNRAQYTSIFADEDYKSALQYADTYQKSIYEAEAKAIDEIQKGILEISQKEEPFDVFICYKETGNDGRRTPDSVLATELYHELTREGFKVFFSRITLEDKLGTAYEPYIFAALHSAKVMVALGTKAEYFNAVWVKNEWSRFLALIKAGERKTLIPAYKDMDPYDLPEEFSHLQAQDMSKLGLMSDLVRGINKILSSEKEKTSVKETVVVSGGNASAAPLLKRAFMFLEDGDWAKADDFCEQVLNQDPENAEAYLGKLMAELQVNKAEQLETCSREFGTYSNFQKAMRFGDKEFKERMENYRLTQLYNAAVAEMNKADSETEYKVASTLFEKFSGFKDADELAKLCLEKAEECRKDSILADGKLKMSDDSIYYYEEAIKIFRTISGWRDADEQTLICQKRIEEIKAKEEKERLEKQRKKEEAEKAAEEKARKKKIAIIVSAIVAAVAIIIVILAIFISKNNTYNKAMALYEAGKYEQAYESFDEIKGFKDSNEKCSELYYDLFLKDRADLSTLSAGSRHTVGLKKDGTVVAVGDNDKGQCDVKGWTDIVSVAAGNYYTAGLKKDGTVVAERYCSEEVNTWTDIVAIAVGNCYTMGLKKDGTVVSTHSDYNYSQCDMSSWSNIIAIAVGLTHTVGLKADGTVVAVGKNDYGQCDVSGWKDIVAISAGSYHTVGLKKDGTVVAVGRNEDGQCDVLGWKDIVAITADNLQTLGLKKDGTVMAVGFNRWGQCNVSDWSNIAVVEEGAIHTVGLKADGTVVAVGYNDNGQCNVSDWKDIRVN